MRTLIAIATSVVAAALLLPAAVSAGVVQFSDSWTNEPSSWYMGDFSCTGKPATVAGTGLSSGSVRVIETANPEGAHVRLDVEGSVDLYEAFGPPWDVQLGAYVGTWTYSAHQVEEWTPGGTAAFSGTTHGRIVFADGSSATLKVSFTFLENEDGPKLFFVKAACGGE